MFGNVHLLFHILICFEMFKSKWQDKQFCETLLVYDIQFYHRQLYESHNLNNKIIWTISGFLTQNIAHNIKRTNYAPDATLSIYMRPINQISVYLHLFHIKYKAEGSFQSVLEEFSYKVMLVLFMVRSPSLITTFVLGEDQICQFYFGMILAL